jgi:dTDP-4-dehydrorhamnose reductase
MRVLLLGGTGQIGNEIRAAGTGLDIFAPDRSELDLNNGRSIMAAIAAARWDAVINAAAYTDVDRAESEEPAAFAINAGAVAQLARETGRLDIPFIHISTDYVFDGRKGTPYVENDAVSPLNAYGRSKLAGEHVVRENNPRSVILRTSWIYSPFRRNFVKTMLRLAAECEHLTVVDDQRSCPTAARDVATACLTITTRCASAPVDAPYGTYHFAGADDATWFELARMIVALSGPQTGRTPEVIPVRTTDFSAAAVRPADTRLDCAAIIRDFGLVQRPWRETLQETVNALLA